MSAIERFRARVAQEGVRPRALAVPADEFVLIEQEFAALPTNWVEGAGTGFQRFEIDGVAVLLA